MAQEVAPSIDHQYQELLEFIVQESNKYTKDFDNAMEAAPKCENSKKPIKYDPDGKPSKLLMGIYNIDQRGAPVQGSRKCPHCTSLRFDYKAALNDIITCPHCNGQYQW
jgi:hypothetical protein